MSPGDVDDMLRRVPDSRQAHFLSALRGVLKVARRHRYLTEDITDGVEIARSGVRDAVWSVADLDAMRATCDGPWGAAVWLGCQLMLYSGQRVGDVLALTWNQYDGDSLSLVQQKTGKALIIPCHRDLRAALDEARANARGTVIVARPNGQRFSGQHWREHFNRFRAAAGLGHLQARDFRRTAATRLGEIAGMSDADISSITGHAPGSRALNNVYRMRTAKQARAAVARWEDEG